MLAEFGLRAKGAAMARWRRTLLCVDDNQGCLNIHKTILEDLGYTVLTARSGREGLKVFASNAIDAVLLDYQMAGYERRKGCGGTEKDESRSPHSHAFRLRVSAGERFDS
jgi:DNA-binding NtrC family response regulator